MAAALPEAQQQRQDVDGAGGLLGLLGARSGVSLGQTELLSHCRRQKHKHFLDQATHIDDKVKEIKSLDLWKGIYN